MGLSPETAAAFAESMADDTEPTNADQTEVPNLIPATPEAESETVPDTASLTPTQPEVGMSARQVFQHALMRTQLTRHPDDQPFFLSHAQ